MEEKIINLNEFKKERWKRRIKTKVCESAIWLSTTVKENKEMICLVAPGLIGIGKIAIKGITKQSNLRKETDLKDLYCYDPSLGHYWRLRRKLTNSEWLQVDRRKQKGERLSDILNDLKVLK